MKIGVDFIVDDAMGYWSLGASNRMILWLIYSVVN